MRGMFGHCRSRMRCRQIVIRSISLRPCSSRAPTTCRLRWRPSKCASRRRGARAEVTSEQVEVVETLVSEATAALPLNFRAIRGGQLRPIEAQQAISQLAEARHQYLRAVIGMNRAQLQLLRALGNPPDAAVIEPPRGALPLEPLPVPPEPAAFR